MRVFKIGQKLVINFEIRAIITQCKYLIPSWSDQQRDAKKEFKKENGKSKPHFFSAKCILLFDFSSLLIWYDISTLQKVIRFKIQIKEYMF